MRGLRPESNPALAARYQPQAIPYLLVLKNGQPCCQKAGVAPPAEMRRWLESA